MRYFQKYSAISRRIIALLAQARAGRRISKSAGPVRSPRNSTPAATPSATPAGPVAVIPRTRSWVTSFALLSKDQVDQAYDYLTNGTKFAKENRIKVADLKVKTKGAIRANGQTQGYELLTIQNVGTHLMRSTYLSLGKSYPLRWKFYFYRSDKTRGSSLTCAWKSGWRTCLKIANCRSSSKHHSSEPVIFP